MMMLSLQPDAVTVCIVGWLLTTENWQIGFHDPAVPAPAPAAAVLLQQWLYSSKLAGQESGMMCSYPRQHDGLTGSAAKQTGQCADLKRA